MPEETLIPKRHLCTVNYKAKGGVIKSIEIMQEVEPGKLHFTFEDIRMLARQVSNFLREDAL